MIDVRLRPEDIEDSSNAEELVVGGKGVLTPSRVRRLKRLTRLRKIEIRYESQVTRAAIDEIAKLSSLESLTIWTIKKGGRLKPFINAAELRSATIAYSAKPADICAILRAPSLNSLSVQMAEIDSKAAHAIARANCLKYLDVEGCYPFNSDHVAVISKSTSLEELLLCGVDLSKVGLGSLTPMKQLRRLDVWATGIKAADLELLHKLPSLEWVSIGASWGGPGRTADEALEILCAHKSLKGVWFDDVPLTKKQISRLDARFEDVYATIEADNEWHDGPTPWPLFQKRPAQPTDQRVEKR